jgi:hypothetical protein
VFHELMSSFRRHLTPISKKRHVTHLPARTNSSLPIEMEHGPWNGQQIMATGAGCNRANLFADEIHHDRRAQKPHFAERHAADNTHLLLKLRHTARIESIVAGIVGAGCNFINEQTAAGCLEELNTENAYAIQRRHRLRSEGSRSCRHVRRHRRGRQCYTQDTLLMPILDDRVDPALACLTARHEDGELPLKIYELLENPPEAWLDDRPQCLLDLRDIGALTKDPLPFAVVAGCRCLADGRDTNLFNRPCQLIWRLDRGEQRDGKEAGLQEPLLFDSILNNPKHGTGRSNPAMLF